MNINWLGIISTFLSLTGFFIAFRISTIFSVARKIQFSALALLLALPGLSFATYYTHLFGETNWYFQFRSLPGTELLVIFIGITGGFILSLLPRFLLIIPFLGIAAFSIAPFIKPFVGPLEEPLQNDWDEDTCLQSSPSTCGPASLATILRHLEIDVTEAQLAEEAYSYRGGTEAWYLARAARARDTKVTFDFTKGFSDSTTLPALAGVRIHTIGHFIPILKQDGENFLIGDPVVGSELISRKDLLKRYDFTGFFMSVGK